MSTDTGTLQLTQRWQATVCWSGCISNKLCGIAAIKPTPGRGLHLEGEGADAKAVTVHLAAVQCRANLPSGACRCWGAGGAEDAGHVRVHGAQVEQRVRGPAGEALHGLQRAQHAGAGLRVAQPRLDGRQLQRAAASLRPDTSRRLQVISNGMLSGPEPDTDWVVPVVHALLANTLKQRCTHVEVWRSFEVADE